MYAEDCLQAIWEDRKTGRYERRRVSPDREDTLREIDAFGDVCNAPDWVISEFGESDDEEDAAFVSPSSLPKANVLLMHR